MKKIICLSLAMCLLFAQTFVVKAEENENKIYRYFFEDQIDWGNIPDINGYDECVLGMMHYNVFGEDGVMTSDTNDHFVYTPSQNGQLTITLDSTDCFPESDNSFGIVLTVYDSNNTLIAYDFYHVGKRVRTVTIDTNMSEAVTVKLTYASGYEGYLLNPYKLYFEYK